MVFLARCVAALAAHFPTKPACCKRVCEGLRVWELLRRLLVVGVTAMSTRAWAQGPVDGAIRGHISAVCGSYPRRCVAGDVRVHLTSPDLGVERDVDADSEGDFLLLRLPPGEYELRATSRTEGGQGIGGIAVARLDLEGGDFDEVTLTLGAPRLSAQAGVPGLSLTGFGAEAYDPAALDLAKQLESLPLESRQWEDLVELDSEASEETSATQTEESASDDEGDPASRVSARDGATATGMSYAGLSSTQGEFSLDGLSGDQSFRAGPRGSATGGASSGASYNQGSVRSFRVLPRNFSAQYGMVGGMAVVSREASSVLHGAAFVRARESAWAATNPFSIASDYNNGVVTSEAVKPQGSQLQFGGSVGVPLGRSSGAKARRGRSRFQRAMEGREPLSLFASVEAMLRDDHIVSTPATANFYNLSDDQMALLANRGVDGTATNAALDYLESLTGATERQAYRVMGTVRLDASLTARDHVTASYAGNRFDSPSGAALGQASDAVVSRGMGSLGDSVVHVDVGIGRWLHGFSKNLNNELRGQIAHDLDYQTPHAPLAQEPAIGPYGYAPQVSIAPNGFSFGTPSSMAPGGKNAYPDEVRFELADTVQWHMGRHALMVGADWSRIHDRIDTLSAEEGAFSYDSGTTNGKDGGLVDWITDYTFSVHAYPNGACRDRRQDELKLPHLRRNVSALLS